MTCANCKERPLNPKLSVSEMQIAERVAQAKLNKEIAFELGITAGTVAEYMQHIFRKTGARNRADLALRFLAAQ